MILDSEYILKTDNTNLPLTTSEVNEHLKESFADISADVYLSLLIKAVEKFGEGFTKRTFTNKTFLNYRTCFNFSTNINRVGFELRRSKLSSITSFKYVDSDGATQTIDSSNYLTSFSKDFSTLYFVDTYILPELSTNVVQPITIEFVAGYGADESSIPYNIKLAMLQHLAEVWANRGDCVNQGGISNEFLYKMLPPESRMIYSQERIIDVIL